MTETGEGETGSESSGDGDGDTGDGDGDTGDGDGDTGDGDGDEEPLDSCPGNPDPCMPGEICDATDSCVPASFMDECELGPEAFVELELPPEIAAIEALGLGIVDVDQDGDGELVLLHPFTVSVLLDDDSVVSSNNPEFSAPDRLAAVFRNNEQLPALAIASTTTGDEAREMENLGGGMFSDDGPVPFAGEFPRVKRLLPADLDLDEELNDMLGMRINGRVEVWDDGFSGLSHADFSDVSEARVDFTTADWDVDGDDDFVAVPQTLIGLHHWENTGEMFDNPVTWSDSAIEGPAMAWQALVGGELNGDMAGDIAAIVADEEDMRTAFGLWNGGGDGSFFGETLSVVPGVYALAEALALGPGAKREVVLVSEGGSRLVFTAEDPSSMCWEQLPFSGVALATGDLDGDQRDEIAVLDAQGQVSVWTRE